MNHSLAASKIDRIMLFLGFVVGALIFTRVIGWLVTRLSIFLAVRYPKRFHGPSPVEVDDVGVRRKIGGKMESIAWADLAQVTIVTTNEGPWAEDAFFLLQDSAGNGCAVPNEEVNKSGLLDRLGKLPGFDHNAVITAMGSTDNASFVCWQANAGKATTASES